MSGILFIFIGVLIFLFIRLFDSFITYKCCMDTYVNTRLGKEKICGIEVDKLKLVYVHNVPKVKFDNFYNIYQINPDKYELLDGYVVRHEEEKDIVFSFNFHDYKKYTKFRKEEVKRRKDDRMLQELIKLAKCDVKNMRNKAKSEIEQAREITEKIMKGG